MKPKILKYRGLLFFVLLLCSVPLKLKAQTNILLEAETFANKGGWKVDQQYVHLMGSSYLLAHGMGVPVENASTSVELPEEGEYSLWVRTKDWVPEHETTPGTFKVKLNQQVLDTEFGTNQGWNWVFGGVIELTSDSLIVELIDQSGFDGRCDALFLTSDTSFVPPNNKEELHTWRRRILDLPEEPEITNNFDVVIVGGGMGGCCAAIAAAREGCSVALIQDRPVLGGNASEEIRVHTIGMEGYRIVEEVNTEHYSNGSDEAKVSQNRRNYVLMNEPNVSVFLSTRAYTVNKVGRNINSIDARNILTGKEYRFKAKQFIDCTGDGWIGYWAGNRFMMGREPKTEYDEELAPEQADSLMMGSSLLFNSVNATTEQFFPDVPWAMDVAKDYSATSGEWFWEYGIGLDPFADAEYIRDHLLRAIYGGFYNAKKNSSNAYKKLNWVGYVQGKRESRRLVGEYILTENDVRKVPTPEDGVVIEKREIDLHLTRTGNYDFLTKAYFTHINPYKIPFRCFIAADLDNLMMAGRCLSATHVGLGSPRVMNTVGQMGVATGVAAGLCIKYNIQPRGVHENHLQELKNLVTDGRELSENAIILDNFDNNVVLNGAWTESTFNPQFYNLNYIHDADELKGYKTVIFPFSVPETGSYQVYTRHTTGDSRASNVPVDIENIYGITRVLVNQQEDDGLWVSLGTFNFEKDNEYSIKVSNEGTNGHVIVDAFALVPDNITSALLQESLETYGFQSITVANNTINFNVTMPSGKGALELYSIEGKKIASTIINFSEGKQTITWNSNGDRTAQGIFIVKVMAGNKVYSQKFVL